MGSLQLQPILNVNIEIIDQQHQMLLKLLNELYSAISQKRDRAVMRELLKKLGMYAEMHFAREENFFDLYGYPNTDEHLSEHDYFEDMIAQFEDEFNAGKQELSVNVLNFLSDWLINHINGSDQDYVPFFKSKGIVV